MPTTAANATVVELDGPTWGPTVRRLVVIVTMLVVGLALTPTPAMASDGALLIDVPGDADGFTSSPKAPLLRVEKLAPGLSRRSEIAVRNTSGHTARLTLAIFDVVDTENGCLEPGTRELGEGCAEDGGELGDWLTVSVARVCPDVLTS